MKRVGFIGAYNKLDMVVYVAKILTLCGKRVLVVDSTISQVARYTIPAINPATTYVTEFEGIDIAVGFNSFEQIRQYLKVSGELPYDIALIDIENPYNIPGFELDETQRNYYVTGFDLFSLKRGIQIISLIQKPLKLTKILYSQDILREENEYLDHLALGYKIEWTDERIYFPIENGDLSVIAENQRVNRIKFKKLSTQYKDSLFMIACEVGEDVDPNQIKRAIKIIEKGM